jgi:LysR family glycine cleavage system transcriptional activator
MASAAKSLNVTMSALSHQMKQLEHRLGFTLLIRQPRGVQMTAEGKRLLERVAPHIDAIGEAFQPYAAGPNTIVTLSASPAMANAWLVPKLGGFVSDHPDIEINLQSNKHMVDFERQLQFDGAIRCGDGLWPGLVVELLLEEWLIPTASPGLVDKMGGVDGLPLETWPLLGSVDGQWQRWFDMSGAKAPSRYVAVLDDCEDHRAAAEGVGVALTRVTQSHALIESGELVVLSKHRLRAPWSHWLVYPERSKSHNAFTAFRNWIRGEAAQCRAVCEGHLTVSD